MPLHNSNPDGDATWSGYSSIGRSEWNCSTGTTRYSLINDAVYQPTAPTVPGGYIDATVTSTGQTYGSQFSMQNVTVSNPCPTVTIWVYGVNDASGSTISVSVYLGGAWQSSTNLHIGTTAQWKSATYSYTGTARGFTQTDINNLQVEITATGVNGSPGAKVYAMYASIYELSSQTQRTGTPTSVTNCAIWYDAQYVPSASDGDAIYEWLDGSGNNNHGYAENQVNLATYKINILNTNQSVMRFDGSTNYYRIPPYLTHAQSGEVFVVLRETYGTAPLADANHTGLWKFGNNDNTLHPNSDGDIYEEFGNKARYAWTPNANADLSQWHVYNVISHPADFRAAINGQWSLARTYTTSGVDFPQTEDATPGCFYLGRASGTNVFFKGDIAELIVYGRRLSDSERSTINSYLSSKYGITIHTSSSAPTNHLYLDPAGDSSVAWAATTTDSCEYHLAASDSTPLQWTPSTGTSHYSLIAQEGVIDTTKYISAATGASSLTDRFTFGTLGLSPASVNVNLVFRTNYDGSHSITSGTFRISFDGGTTWGVSGSLPSAPVNNEWCIQPVMNNSDYAASGSTGGQILVEVATNTGTATPNTYDIAAFILTVKGTPHYLLINHGSRLLVRNGDTLPVNGFGSDGYVERIQSVSSSSLTDEFTMTSQTISSLQSVTSVKVYLHGWCDASASPQVQVYMGGAWQTALTVSLTSGTSSAPVWNSASFSGSWGQTDINNMKVRIISSAAGSSYVTTMYADVAYTLVGQYNAKGNFITYGFF